MPENSPQSLGRYTIHAELGRGGFATVYRATDTVLERDVALKILKPGWTDDAKAVERFMREARVASRLDHPGIVTIYDVGAAEGRLYIAMKLLPGQPLDRLIKSNGPLTWDRTLALMIQVTEALDYAHAQGLVHRDIKPANLIVGEYDHAVLTDFGLVRGAEQASLSTGTTGGILGTPEYIPPEVWEGQPATNASDIYSLACVMYEMLFGSPLFAADTGAAVMRKHVLIGPEFPANWPPDVPNEVPEVLRRALAHEPSDRYATAGALASALREGADMQAAREQEARETRQNQEEAERAAQAALALAATRQAEEERTRREAERKAKEEADRRVREEQERQRQAELAAKTAEEEKAKRDAAERERQRQAEVSRRETNVPALKAKSNRKWLYAAGGAIAVVAIVVVLASIRPAPPAPTPAPAKPAAAVGAASCAPNCTYKDMVLCFPQLGAASDWCIANTDSMKETATQLGIKQLIYSDAQQKQENQISAVRACIQQGVDVIALPPVVETGWDAVLTEAKNADIPVIIVDRSVSADPSLYASHIGSDMVLEGQRAAEQMNKLLPNGGSILELSGTTGSGAAVGRARGFREKLNPNIKIIDSQTGNFTRAEGKPVMEAFLKKYPGQVQGVFIHSDDMAIGAIEAMKAAGIKPGDLKIVSVDGTRGGFQAMVDGWIQADVECNPLLGPQIFEMALKLMNGQPVDGEVVTNESVYFPDKAQDLLPTRKY